jgi:hypothetical protein
MTREFWFFGPVLLLSLASIGAGALALRPARALKAALPYWLVLVLEYFMGQGVLAALFLGLALAGRFTAWWLVPPLGVLAILALVSLGRRRRDAMTDAHRAWRAWRAAPLAWKAVSVATAGLFLYGFTSIAGSLIVDAPAFYLAISRLIAGTGRLTALPGYDSFSAVGLFGELHVAALFTLGMDGTLPRVLSWINFIPTIAVIHGLSRLCGLGRRGAVITVAAAVTTSSITSLWGSGKTDLFAIGPALAACVIIVALWERDRLGWAPFVAGFLFGGAALSKLSYIVAFLPALTILMIWQRAHVRPALGLADILRSAVPVGFAFGVGFLLVFGQNLAKNQILLGQAFASFAMDPFFSAATVRRILLTYPAALTYGRYWGQVGTLSPIVLAFLLLVPAYQRWPVEWRESRLLAVGAGAAAGLLVWVVLYPSMVMPRYIQATLLLLAIPGAAAAEIATRRSTILAWFVPVGIVATIYVTPRQTEAIVPTFSPLRATMRTIAGPPYTCQGASPFVNDCLAQIAINHEARPGDLVLGLSYLRFWLDPKLMQSMSTSREVAYFRRCPRGPCTAEQFWARIRETPFRFMLNDSVSHPAPSGALEAPPPDIELRRLFQAGNVSSWEVRLRSEKR